MAADKSLSVLRNVSAADVIADPYPHVIVHDALPDEICDRLIAEYPPLSVLGVDAAENNSRWSVPACDVARNTAIARIWQDIIAYHTSPTFFAEVVDVFGAYIVRLYPHVFPTVDALRSSSLGIRDEEDESDTCDLSLDAQIAGNTPVREACSVKTAHIDSEHKLFTALLYLRSPQDDSAGGDLDILRFRRDLTPAQRSRRYDGVYTEDAFVEQITRVPYARNTLFMFANGLEALHGVTVREPTEHLRLFMNLVGETRVKLFDIPQHWERRAARLPRLIGKRIRRLVGV